MRVPRTAWHRGVVGLGGAAIGLNRYLGRAAVSLKTLPHGIVRKKKEACKMKNGYVAMILLAALPSLGFAQTTTAGSAAVIYTGNQSIQNATTVRFNFSEKVHDPSGLVATGADWRFTAPESEIYHVSLSMAFAFPPSDPYFTCAVYRLPNGTSQKERVLTINAFDVNCTGSTDFILEKGDLVFIEVGQAGGVTRNVQGRVAIRSIN